MDRDIAWRMVQKITAINTALQGIVTGTTPTANNRGVAENRSIEEPETEPETEPVEPETRKKK